MTFGPIVSRELSVVARRARSYRQRCILAIALSLAVVPHVGLIGAMVSGGFSIREMALISQSVFLSAAATQVFLTILLVPGLVAGAVAEERERRSLSSLLTTRLTSAEIVLGKLAAGLVHYTACLATTLPIMIMLPLLGGIDPRMVLLAYAGTASTAFLVAGLSIAVSTSERRAARAVGKTIGLATLWCALPLIVASRVPFLLPQYWPRWVYDANGWVLASSPVQPLSVVVRFGADVRFLDSIFWMIVLQLALGILLIVWTVARLRTASRRLEDGDSIARGHARIWRGQFTWWLGRRPCGDNPVLWKELHTLQSLGFAETAAVLVALSLVALTGYATFTFARPAFVELFASRHSSSISELHRREFNRFLCYLTSCVEFLILLVAAGVAAGTVTGERARDTWDSLIATPLSGRDILRAKMMGTAWKVRWGAVLLIILWSVGVFAGALHPAGFLVAAVLLGVSTWFMVSIGTYMSLISSDSRQASSRTLIPALLLSGSFLTFYVSSRYATVFLGAFSPPFVNWICLVSPGEIRDVMSGEETFHRLGEIGLYTYESPSRVLGACLLGVAGFGAGAVWFSRAAFKAFDRIAGRPERRRDETVQGLAPSPPRRRRKRPALVVVSILAVLSIGVGIWSNHAARSLREALAETDRLLPGWRLDDLEAARELVPDAKNAALRVTAAVHLLPLSWRNTGGIAPPSMGKHIDEIAMLSPVQSLSPESRQALRAALEEARPALEEARGLSYLCAGRFPVAWTRDGISTRLPHLATIRALATLLACDATLQSEAGNADASLAACRTLLNAGRSIGDEPTMVSQRRRMDLRITVCHQLERALAHGQPSDAAMAALKQSLDIEEIQPLLVFGIRGERAITDRFLAAVDSGEFTNTQIHDAGFSVTEMLSWKSAETRATQLRFSNRAEQIAALPADEQQSAFQRLAEDTRNLPSASRSLVPAILQVATAYLSSRARLRCAGAALACERYRVARGAWPSELKDLAPEFVAGLPIDPFDGKPLRFHRKNGQVVIYSVGEDRRDDGGQTEAQSHATVGRDLEFRLWDPSLRSAR